MSAITAMSAIKGLLASLPANLRLVLSYRWAETNSSPIDCWLGRLTGPERLQGTSYVKGTYKRMEQSAPWRLNHWIQRRN